MNSDMHNRLSARVSTLFCGVKRRQAFICAVGTQPCQGTECGASERARKPTRTNDLTRQRPLGDLRPGCEKVVLRVEMRGGRCRWSTCQEDYLCFFLVAPKPLAMP